MDRRIVAVGLAVLVGIAGMGWWMWRAPPPGGTPVERERAARRSDASTPAARRSGTPPGPPAAAPVRLPPPGTPVRQVMTALRAAADRGEPRAACRIAVELTRCHAAAQALRMADAMGKRPPTPGGVRAMTELLDRSEATARDCSGLPAFTGADIYRYQAIAAEGGDADLERWMVTAPAIDRFDFLSNLDAWADYRTRARRYATSAITRQERIDLPILLLVYAPADGSPRFPGTLRVDDDAMFLALYDVAKASGIQPLPFITEAAQTLRADMPANVRERHRALTARVAGPWKGELGANALGSMGLGMDTPDPSRCADVVR